MKKLKAFAARFSGAFECAAGRIASHPKTVLAAWAASLTIFAWLV